MANQPTCKIPLTNGGFAIIDKEDFDKVSKYSWCRLKSGQITTTLYLHRLVFRKNVRKNECVDHIDGNTLNNRKCNLRACTLIENFLNSRKWRRKCSSKYKGVCWDKGSRRWVARIGFNHKRYCLGYFKSERKAAKAYNEAAEKFHKQFAKLNEV